MSTPRILNLGTIPDISVGGATPAQMLDENYNWSITPLVVGTASNAKYTVRVSHDNVNYYNYKIAATNVAIETPIQDDGLPWKWMVILVTPGGSPTGTAQFSFLGKRK